MKERRKVKDKNKKIFPKCFLKGEHNGWMVSVGRLNSHLRHWIKKNGIYLKKKLGDGVVKGKGCPAPSQGDVGAMLAAPGLECHPHRKSLEGNCPWSWG